MPDFEEHCQKCEEILGKPFKEVHQWLDEFISILPLAENYKHRQFRHHREGIEKVGQIFGDEAQKAAQIHIEMDNEGKTPFRKEYAIEEYKLSKSAMEKLKKERPEALGEYFLIHGNSQ